MSGFAKFRDGFIGPVIILTVIGLLCTWAVAATHVGTKPLIAEQERLAAETARQEVLTEGEGFSQYKNIDLPEGVAEAYRADNGAGYVFRVSAKGFDGQVPFMVGLDPDGNITGIKMLDDNNETPGLGSKVGAAEYLAQYIGGNDPTTIDGITGATKTSTALKNALTAALSTYEQIKDITPTGEGS